MLTAHLPEQFEFSRCLLQLPATQGITFGVGYRAASAQDCCDKCKEHATKHPGPTDPKGRGPCNSWTFCDLPVCWGLDTGEANLRAKPVPRPCCSSLLSTRSARWSRIASARALHMRSRQLFALNHIGWNHTYGECWLRHLADPEHPSFVQRGELSPEYRLKMMGTRKGCRLDEPWACPPTHVPWTSGSPGFKSYDPLVRWSTSGGWGNMRVSRISPTGDATLVMVNGKPALPQAT